MGLDNGYGVFVDWLGDSDRGEPYVDGATGCAVVDERTNLQGSLELSDTATYRALIRGEISNRDPVLFSLCVGRCCW